MRPQSPDLTVSESYAAKPPAGLRERGNIDLYHRPMVKNADGSISTVRSMSFGTDKGEVLVPTVSDDGRIMSNEEALQQYRQTGKHLGIFDTPENATAYSLGLHRDQERLYQDNPKPYATNLSLDDIINDPSVIGPQYK